MFAHLKPLSQPHGVTSRIKGFNTPSSLITKLEKDNNIDPMCRGRGQSYARQRYAGSQVWRRLCCRFVLPLCMEMPSQRVTRVMRSQTIRIVTIPVSFIREEITFECLMTIPHLNAIKLKLQEFGFYFITHLFYFIAMVFYFKHFINYTFLTLRFISFDSQCTKMY